MNLRSIVVALLVVVASQASLAAGDPPVKPEAPTKPACPERLDGFVNGDATAKAIVTCIGKPASEDHNPDGRFVYLYKLKDNITITYLFDTNETLVRTNVYKTTPTPKAP